jgi:hypothetical protein
MASARSSVVTGLSLTAMGLVAVLLLVACGSSNPSPSASGAVIVPSASGGASLAAPSSSAGGSGGEFASGAPSGSLTTGPSSSPAPSADGSGGGTGATPAPTPAASAGGGGDVSAQLCQKLTVGEIASATDLDGLTARPEFGDATGGSCSYLAGDRAVAATMIVTSGGKLAMDAIASQAEPVPNLGDAAAWVAQTSSLYIRKGDTVVRIQLLPSIIPPDVIKARTVALGTILAGRF